MRCRGKVLLPAYPAWRPPANPAFIPLGGLLQTQCLSRLAASCKPSISPACRPSTNPAFIPLGGLLQTQRLSHLAVAHKPSIYPAWRPPANPVFIPLGGRPGSQCLSRLAHCSVRAFARQHAACVFAAGVTVGAAQHPRDFNDARVVIQRGNAGLGFFVVAGFFDAVMRIRVGGDLR